MKFFIYINVFIFTLTIFIFSRCIKANAVEIAPRISDREIVESLAVLKNGQEYHNKRFDDVNKRFDDINKRIDDLSVNVNERFNSLQNTMLSLFGAIIALIIALFGYIAWDRRTAIKPMRERLDRIEMDLIRDLDFQHKDGSLVTRLLNALRELAKKDKKLAEVLRSFSLM